MNQRISNNSQWSERLPPWVIAALFILVAIVVAAYIYGIPMLAQAAANRFPSGIAARIESETLAALDREVFSTSAIPVTRQQTIASAFRALERPAGSTNSYNLVFRRSEAIGANAMALQANTIIVTDGLVELARDDREILGVLAHEAGHIDRRHNLRGLIQNSLISMLLAVVMGDVSAITAVASSSLLEASYSRDLEREADAYAVETLRANRIPLKHLADMLRRLEAAAGAAGTSSARRYLSTHPATEERIRQLSGS